MMQKVAVRSCLRGWALPCDDWKGLCQPSSKWVPFSNQGRIRQRKERDVLRHSSAVTKIHWDSKPHCHYGYWATGNLYIFLTFTLIFQFT